jgi:4-hydroxy-3-polyprenylbenzoate decarboxylase
MLQHNCLTKHVASFVMLKHNLQDAPLVVAMTGASGAVYATRLLEVLLEAGREIHLLISPSGAAVIEQELHRTVSLDRFDVRALLPDLSSDSTHGTVRYHHHGDFIAPPASGSCLTAGMVVCPCSGSTLSGIAHGASTNLIQRAAEVHLKERRPLILVPRETPLSLIYIDNMRKAAEAGAVILPASPGWYHGVQSLQDLVDFVVARILDQLGIPHQLMRRWGEPS